MMPLLSFPLSVSFCCHLPHCSLYGSLDNADYSTANQNRRWTRYND